MGGIIALVCDRHLIVANVWRGRRRGRRRRKGGIPGWRRRRRRCPPPRSFPCRWTESQISRESSRASNPVQTDICGRPMAENPPRPRRWSSTASGSRTPISWACPAPSATMTTSRTPNYRHLDRRWCARPRSSSGNRRRRRHVPDSGARRNMGCHVER